MSGMSHVSSLIIRLLKRVKASMDMNSQTTNNISKIIQQKYLSDGYIRLIECNQLIPDSIKDLCFCYFVKYMVFDVYPDYHKQSVLQDGMIIKGSCKYVQYGVSTGFNEGYHEWSVRAMQISQDGIGVIDNLSECEQSGTWIHSSSNYAYFLWGGGGLYSSKYHHETHSQQSQKWKKNDIITVCLNCDEMTVKFKINHKEIARP
eukprot:291234_1